MKKHLSTIILVTILVIGLSLLLYPSVADWWNSFHATKAIASYDSIVANMSDEDYTGLFEDAREYNRQLAQIKYPLMYYDAVGGYYELLNVTGNGIMGYVDIPRIDVRLPIYHGTSEGVLQIAAGHMQGTSLPTGGESTHCALSAHRGLPSARLFTDLDELEKGDTFTLNVIDRVLTYEIDQILIVEPSDVEPLYVEEGKDYCTLVTCTPYGINSHRMLVRGIRTDNAADDKAIRVTADAMLVEPVLVAPVLAAPILLLMLLMLLLPNPKKKKNRKKKRRKKL